MTVENQQVVSAYLDGMSIDSIVSEFSLPEAGVKMILMQFCPEYRRVAKTDESLQFKQADAEDMMAIIVGIARYADDDPHLQFKAAKFVLEDKKGRLDKLANQGNKKLADVVNFNLVMESTMKKALEAEARTMKLLKDEKAVDVEVANV